MEKGIVIGREWGSVAKRTGALVSGDHCIAHLWPHASLAIPRPGEAGGHWDQLPSHPEFEECAASRVVWSGGHSCLPTCRRRTGPHVPHRPAPPDSEGRSGGSDYCALGCYGRHHPLALPGNTQSLGLTQPWAGAFPATSRAQRPSKEALGASWSQPEAQAAQGSPGHVVPSCPQQVYPERSRVLTQLYHVHSRENGLKSLEPALG